MRFLCCIASLLFFCHSEAQAQPGPPEFVILRNGAIRAVSPTPLVALEWNPGDPFLPEQLDLPQRAEGSSRTSLPRGLYGLATRTVTGGTPVENLLGMRNRLFVMYAPPGYTGRLIPSTSVPELWIYVDRQGNVYEVSQQSLGNADTLRLRPNGPNASGGPKYGAGNGQLIFWLATNISEVVARELIPTDERARIQNLYGNNIIETALGYMMTAGLHPQFQPNLAPTAEGAAVHAAAVEKWIDDEGDGLAPCCCFDTSYDSNDPRGFENGFYTEQACRNISSRHNTRLCYDGRPTAAAVDSLIDQDVGRPYAAACIQALENYNTPQG